jgi:hypothetical protein
MTSYHRLFQTILEAGMRLQENVASYRPKGPDGHPFIITLGRINNLPLSGFENHIEVYFPIIHPENTKTIVGRIKDFYAKAKPNLTRTFSFTLGLPITQPQQQVIDFQQSTSFDLEKKQDKIRVLFFSSEPTRYVKDSVPTADFKIIDSFLRSTIGESLFSFIDSIDLTEAKEANPIDPKLFRDTFVSLVGQKTCNFCDHTESQTDLTPFQHVFFCSNMCQDARLKTLEKN